MSDSELVPQGTNQVEVLRDLREGWGILFTAFTAAYLTERWLGS